jgi:prevent-host-death family protein
VPAGRPEFGWLGAQGGYICHMSGGHGGVVEIDIRALRAGLSQYLADVQRGHTVTVADHGTVIARIVPAARQRPIGDGRVRPARRPMPEPVMATGLVSDLVAEQRR